jgi:4-carboxymuconolactone decarboxylase
VKPWASCSNIDPVEQRRAADDGAWRRIGVEPNLILQVSHSLCSIEEYQMHRIPDWTVDSLSPVQRKVHDAILEGPRGAVQGPLRVWLQSPNLAQNAQALGAFCRFGTSLPPRLSELAILIMGAYWRAGFEWHVHAPIAITAGISPEVAEAIRTRGKPQFVQDDEAAIYAFARELIDGHAVSDPTYRAVEDCLGKTRIVELVGILGYYGLISMTIVAFQVPVPAGFPDPFTTS